MYNHILNTQERECIDSFDKVIIWGFPLHTHTHSYIHAMWYKAFKEGFNKDTYWFHDKEYPVQDNFNYNNCLFISEGYADYKIPILDTSTYFILNAINPSRYIDKNARLIEIRFNVVEMHDINNDFNLNDGTHENLIELTNNARYEKLYSNKDLHSSKRDNKITKMDYECIYLYWATDLLPHEISYNDIQIKKDNSIYYLGSPGRSINYHLFKGICESQGIKWLTNNPWVRPLSFEDNKNIMQKSLLCPDFRPIGTDTDTEEFGIKNGKNHLEIGYLPCRVLKAISYGQVGITDSIHVKNILKEHVLYDSDMNKLFIKAMENKNNISMIKASMEYVKNNHTYINRVRELVKALVQK